MDKQPWLHDWFHFSRAYVVLFGLMIVPATRWNKIWVWSRRESNKRVKALEAQVEKLEARYKKERKQHGRAKGADKILSFIEELVEDER